MKRILLITVLFLGFSIAGFSQTTEKMYDANVNRVYPSTGGIDLEITVMDKETGSLYGLYVQANEKAQIYTGEIVKLAHDNVTGAPRYIVKSDGAIYDIFIALRDLVSVDTE